MMDEKEIKFREAMAEFAKTDRQALAEIITEFIDPNHVTTELIGQFLPTRNLKPGDFMVKKVRKGIHVRKLFPGAIHLASEITVQDTTNYAFEGADVKVLANLWDLESGELGTTQDIIREVYAKLQDYYVARVINLMSTVWTAVNTPNNFSAPGATVTQAALEAMIDQITLTTGGVKAVVGTRTALQPIARFSTYEPITIGAATTVLPATSLLEEYKRSGWFGRYYGVDNYIAINQVRNNLVDYEAMVPDNFILVIGENVGEFVTYGDVKTKQYDDMEPTPPNWMYEIWTSWGMIIDNVEGIGLIRLG